MKWSNKRSAPSGARALVPSGEALLAWATGPGRGPGTVLHLAATDAGLRCDGDWFNKGLATTFVRWSDVDSAAWDDPVLELKVRASDTVAAASLGSGSGASTGAIVRLHLDDAGAVPVVIHERVVHSIVFQQKYDLPGTGGASATFIARRRPDRDEVDWTVSLDRGVDPEDESVAAAVDAKLRDLRSTLGI